MKKLKRLLNFFVLCFALFACAEKKGESRATAIGLSGDMYVIMDSLQWKGPLGQLINATFGRDMEVLNRTEPLYKVRWIDARKLSNTLKQRRNLIFAVTLDQNSQGANRVKGMFTKESTDKIKSDTSFFLTTSTNLFAKGQEVMFLVGTSEKDLIKKVKKNAVRLTDYFDRSEQERLTATIFKSGQMKGITDWLRKNFGVEIRIPFGYQLVMQNNEFLWARQINKKNDMDIFITRKKYTSPAQFTKDSLIELRNELCKKYLFGNPEKPLSYLITETGVSFKPVLVRDMTYRGKYAKEMRGLWRTNNLSMGGPFVSYTLVDEAQGMLYYIEGFCYVPGQEQREIMRELEVILNTFRTSGELTVAK
jgi:Domain of unknown function (DUF4837)